MLSFIIIFRCDSIEKLKLKLPTLENELRDAVKFKDFYNFTFNYAKNPGQKGLGKCVFNILLDKFQICARCTKSNTGIAFLLTFVLMQLL